MVDKIALQRRSFLAGLASALALPLLPGTARAASVNDGAPRVLVLGGSTMIGALGSYLEKGFQKLGYETHRKAKSSSGLARPDFFDWPKTAAELYASFQPDATVVMFGGNDGQGLRMPEGTEPEWIRYNDEGWTEEYRRRVVAFANTVCPSGEHLFWIGMPAMRQSKLDSRMQRMNAIFEAEMQARSHGHFIETRLLLSGGKDEYRGELKIDGKFEDVRAGDGIHLARAGANLIVERVVPIVQKQLGAGA